MDLIVSEEAIYIARDSSVVIHNAYRRKLNSGMEYPLTDYEKDIEVLVLRIKELEVLTESLIEILGEGANQSETNNNK